MLTNKKNLVAFFLCLLCSVFSKADMNLFPEENKQLIIQNRVLVKIGDSTISVLDVVKKMEVFLNKHYPQYADSLPAKYQYFSTQWKDMLLQMIDHELILLDADKMELKITDSEIRETLFEKFGPNVMTTLDKIGVSYEEAKAMIHSELAVQKMTWFKVHAKALSAVNAQDVKSAYTSYCEKNPPKEEWEYQTLSIRAQNEEIAYQIAQKAFDLCRPSPSIISDIIAELKQPNGTIAEESPPFQITLSDTIKTESKNLSQNYKNILSKLSVQTISEPIKQVNRTDKNSIYRIFYLKNHTTTTTPSLRSLYDKLQNQLVQEESEKEFRVYLSKLRDRYGFNTKLEEIVPANFQPFSLN